MKARKKLNLGLKLTIQSMEKVLNAHDCGYFLAKKIKYQVNVVQLQMIYQAKLLLDLTRNDTSISSVTAVGFTCSF